MSEHGKMMNDVSGNSNIIIPMSGAMLTFKEVYISAAIKNTYYWMPSKHMKNFLIS
jgi:hypothetical protein